MSPAEQLALISGQRRKIHQHQQTEEEAQATMTMDQPYATFKSETWTSPIPDLSQKTNGSDVASDLIIRAVISYLNILKP